MKSLTPTALKNSVIAVPPLARNDDLTLNREENQRIVSHIEAGGVSILLYGGNAVLYHVAPSQYGQMLEMLAELADPSTILIPSVGPAYGVMMDQAAMLIDSPFTTAMILPQKEISTSAGIARAVRDFSQAAQRRVVLYIKHDNYIDVEDVARLMHDDLLSAIKYAIVRENAADDPFLRELADTVGTELMVSGMGEQPAIVHMQQFGLPGFTSGCVCIRPDLSARMLRAVHQNELDIAESIRETFRPLEDLRNSIHPIRVLHEAVALAGIAQTGPLLPCLSALDTAAQEQVAAAATELLHSGQV